MNFSIKDFFSECDQIRSSHSLKKYLMKNFIFCAVDYSLDQYVYYSVSQHNIVTQSLDNWIQLLTIFCCHFCSYEILGTLVSQKSHNKEFHPFLIV